MTIFQKPVIPFGGENISTVVIHTDFGINLWVTKFGINLKTGSSWLLWLLFAQVMPFSRFFGSRQRPVTVDTDAVEVKPEIEELVETEFPISAEFEGTAMKFNVKNVTTISTIFNNFLRRQNLKAMHLRCVDEDGKRLNLVGIL